MARDQRRLRDANSTGNERYLYAAPVQAQLDAVDRQILELNNARNSIIRNATAAVERRTAQQRVADAPPATEPGTSDTRIHGFRAADMLTFEAITRGFPRPALHVGTRALDEHLVPSIASVLDSVTESPPTTEPQVAQPVAEPVAQPGARASTTGALHTGRRESSVLPAHDATLRAADTHGNAMIAAARRVFNVNDPDLNPEGRFVDLCDSLGHPESYLPGETPTPEHTAGIDYPQEPLAQRRT